MEFRKIANNTMTIVAGLLINLGSVIQITSMLYRKRLAMNEKYFHCLTYGCVFLLLGQVWAYIFTSQTLEMIITIITSALSFVCAFSILCIRFTLRERRCGIKVLEGVAGTGKTTIANQSFDYLFYLSKHEIFKEKHAIAPVSILYDINLMCDLFRTFQQQSMVYENKSFIADRDIVSQFVYSLLFMFDGHMKPNSEFIPAVRGFLNRHCVVIKEVFNNYFNLRAALFPNRRIETQVGTVADTGFFTDLANNITRRGTFEVEAGYDLIAYSQNQSWLFAELVKLVDHEDFKIVTVTPFIQIV